MKLRLAAYGCMLLLLGGCGLTDGLFSGNDDGGTPAVGIPEEGERVYLVMEERGQRRSAGYQVMKQDTFRGQPCIVTTRRRTDTLRREGESTVYEIDKRSKVVTALSGAALYAEELTQAGQERWQETVEIRDTVAHFQTVGPEGSKRDQLRVPRGIMFGIEPSWLVQQDLRPGLTLKRTVLDRRKHELVRERVTVLQQTIETVLGAQQPVWVVETQREGYSPQRMIFTTDGRFVRIEDDAMVVRVVTRKEAEADKEPVTIVSTIPTGFKLPAWDNFTHMTFEVAPADAWRKYVRESDYVGLEQRGGRLLLHLKKNPPYSIRVRRDNLPMQVPDDLQPFLQSSKTILPQKIDIMRQARRIIGRDTDVLKCVAQLAGWVHHRIRFRQTGALNPSPLKTLESASGDCSEHADLFASLARSLGIPTRHCQGLLIQKEEAVYHAWVEAWIGGTWVPIDTTVSRVGLPAGYLLTAYGTGDGEPEDEFGWRLRQGDLTMKLLEARKKFLGRAGEEPIEFVMNPAKPRTYIAGEGRWLAHLYWGFTVERPDDWKGAVEMDRVILTSPDRKARLVCEGLAQDYEATDIALNRVVASLQKSLGEFRLLDARILPFVPAGRNQPTDALMVDFTCRQAGQVLRCRQLIVPRRDRSYRIASWAPNDVFEQKQPAFEAILNSIQL